MAMLIYGLLAAFRAFMNAHAGPILHPENLNRLGDLANNPAFRIISHEANGAEIEVFPGVSWIIIIMVVTAGLFQLLLKKTRFGRYAFLVGSNSTASRLSGINVIRVKITSFILASVLAGLVGVLLASRMGGAPGGAVGYEMIGIACAMIGGASLSGGTSNIGGTVVGSFLLSTLAIGLTMMNVNGASIPILLNGLVLLGAVYLDQTRNSKYASHCSKPLNEE
jgi:ribose transport system permease protein